MTAADHRLELIDPSDGRRVGVGGSARTLAFSSVGPCGRVGAVDDASVSIDALSSAGENGAGLRRVSGCVCRG